MRRCHWSSSCGCLPCCLQFAGLARCNGSSPLPLLVLDPGLGILFPVHRANQSLYCSPPSHLNQRLPLSTDLQAQEVRNLYASAVNRKILHSMTFCERLQNYADCSLYVSSSSLNRWRAPVKIMSGQEKEYYCLNGDSEGRGQDSKPMSAVGVLKPFWTGC